MSPHNYRCTLSTAGSWPPLVLSESVPVEELVDPDVPSTAVWDLNLHELTDPQVRDFPPQAAGPVPARSLAASSALSPTTGAGLLRRVRRAASPSPPRHRRGRTAFGVWSSVTPSDN